MQFALLSRPGGGGPGSKLCPVLCLSPPCPARSCTLAASPTSAPRSFGEAYPAEPFSMRIVRPRVKPFTGWRQGRATGGAEASAWLPSVRQKTLCWPALAVDRAPPPPPPPPPGLPACLDRRCLRSSSSCPAPRNPCAVHVTEGGSVCLEALAPRGGEDGWDPSRSASALQRWAQPLHWCPRQASSTCYAQHSGLRA